MPILNLDVVAPATVDIECGERVWKLRADVPSSILVRCFYIVDLQERRPAMEFAPDAHPDLAEVVRVATALDAFEREEEALTLSILGDIWRWSYPGTPDEDLRTWLHPSERGDIVKFFFAILFARSGKRTATATSASSSTASSLPSPETMTKEEAIQEVMTTLATPGATRATSPTSKGRDLTRSATRSPADSSESRPRSMTGEQIAPTETMSANGTATLAWASTS